MKFSLQPFSSTELISNVEIVGQIDRLESQLHLSYQLLGNLEDFLIPPPSNPPTRRDELWRETCFEFFIGSPTVPIYWEFNLSPARDWNIYRFEDYRQGMQRETAFTELPVKLDRQTDSFRLAVDVDIARLELADTNFQCAITAVLRQIDDTLTYWALTHPGSQPDFHLRESFILKL